MASDAPGRRRSRRGCCLGCGAGVVLPVAVLALAIWLNNRPADDVVIPTSPMPAVNGYEDVARAAAMLQGRVHQFPASTVNYNPATYTLADYSAAYREARPALDALHAALRKPYRNPPPRMPDMGFEGYARLREVARTLSGAADYKAKIGQYDEAVDLQLDGLELCAAMQKGSRLIGDLIAIAVQAISIHHMEQYLPSLSKEQLAAAAARLERIVALAVPYSEVVHEEGYAGTAMMKESFSGLPASSPAKYLSNVRVLLDVPADRPPNASEAAQMAQFVLRSKSEMLRSMLAFYEEARQEVSGPYKGHVTITAPDAPFMGSVPDILSKVWEQHTACCEVIDLLRVEVALLRYKADHGRYPVQFSVLAPKYLPKVPDDRCAGKPAKPLQYQPAPDGHSYLLYSVGVDMRDDGGQPARNLRGAGDIVVGHLNGR